MEPPTLSAIWVCAQLTSLTMPLSNKNVGLAFHLAETVRGEHQCLAVVREHREAVEAFVGGDAFGLQAMDVDQVEIEVAALRVVHV